MKRRLLVIIASLLVAGFALPAFAVDFLVGAKTGYYVWEPYFKDMKGSGVEELETGSGVLYGPTIGVLLTDDLSFSAVALYGTQSTYWKNDRTPKNFGPGSITSTGTFYSEITRVDVDTALSYRLAEKFKLFVGYKYQYTETVIRGTFISEKTTLPLAAYVQVGDVLMEVPCHGPALGVGFSDTIGSNFFVSCNLSGLYMFSRHKFTRNRWYSYDVNTLAGTVTLTNTMETDGVGFDTRQIGLNVEPSVGMSVGDVVATLGVRFQWVRIQFIDEPFIGGTYFAPTGWMNDYLYGVFVGAMYKL